MPRTVKCQIGHGTIATRRGGWLDKAHIIDWVGRIALNRELTLYTES